ncbi:MAG: glyceraldehyde-3-phosphate dehydrogenase [Pseudomonadaceae bacterium]|nr:glyceraldehyde-3-phosphate dehydrogenase [Pseudomonadaceae bacterium]
MALPSLDDYFPDWKEREALAEAMIPIIGQLYRKNVVCYCYGRALHNCSVTQIMKIHRYVRQVAKNELSEFESFPVLEAVSKLDLGPCHLDIGKLATGLMDAAEAESISATDYVKRECAEVIGRHVPPVDQPQDVVLYGFGRIGRLLARLLIEKTGGGTQLRVRAIVVRKGAGDDDLAKRASLLRRDSVHGSFQGTIRVDEENSCIIANGVVIKVIYAGSPAEIDYTEYGIDNAIIIDNTGAWRDRDGLSEHLKAKGAAKVILTAPGKGDVPNFVSGVNSAGLADVDDQVIAAASCTTNAIVPVLKVINDEFGIKHGHMETVHSYTNDQNLIDNYHKKNRRGRGAPLNMVITETGATSAVAKLMPELSGKLTGNAIRVPTPNVSLAILNLTLDKAVDREGLNEFLRNASLHSRLQRQIDFNSSPDVVSSDVVGNRHACLVDGQATIASDNSVVLYVWYDNEFGYACQVVRLTQKWAGIKYPLIPKDVEGIGF